MFMRKEEPARGSKLTESWSRATTSLRQTPWAGPRLELSQLKSRTSSLLLMKHVLSFSLKTSHVVEAETSRKTNDFCKNRCCSCCTVFLSKYNATASKTLSRSFLELHKDPKSSSRLKRPSESPKRRQVGPILQTTK